MAVSWLTHPAYMPSMGNEWHAVFHVPVTWILFELEGFSLIASLIACAEWKRGVRYRLRS